MTMGNRGARGGEEMDMLSRNSKRILACPPGRRQAAKQSFAQRQRKDARLVASVEAATAKRDPD